MFLSHNSTFTAPQIKIKSMCRLPKLTYSKLPKIIHSILKVSILLNFFPLAPLLTQLARPPQCNVVTLSIQLYQNRHNDDCTHNNNELNCILNSGFFLSIQYATKSDSYSQHLQVVAVWCTHHWFKFAHHWYFYGTMQVCWG